MSKPAHPPILQKLCCCLFVFFCAFPFIKIFSLGNSYTQPYAFLLSCLFLPVSTKVLFRKGAAIPFLYFTTFALLGCALFCLMCFPYNNLQEYKYLISYLSFPIIAVTALYFAESERKLLILLLKASVLLWLCVGLIQFAFYPSFLTSIIGLPPEMGQDMLTSGRGVLSLAPEPSHYGFHMIMLAAALTLLDEKLRYVMLCLFQAVVLAKSASALMAIAVGVGLAVLSMRKYRFRMIFTSLILAYVTIAALLHFTPQSRIAILLTEFMHNPLEIVHQDASLNFRLGGLIASFDYMINDYLIPHGLGHSTWLQTAEFIRLTNPWLLDISLVGPPSGIGMLLFQAGLLILPHVFFMLFTILRAPTTGWGRVVLCSSIIVVFSQYYIASPPFALVFALSLLKRLQRQPRFPTEFGQNLNFQQSMITNRIAL